MRRSPKPTSRPRTRMTTSRLASASRSMCRSSMPASEPNRREEDGKDAIENDDHEDRLDDRRGHVPSERLGRPLDRKPLDAGDDADHQGHERGLDEADQEGL